MIRRMKVLHYRGLKSIDVQLSSFQILIGPNACGKSSFLDVINLVRDILKDGIRPAIEKRSSDFKELLYNKKGKVFDIDFELEIPNDIKHRLKDKDYLFVRYKISLKSDDVEGVKINNENVWLTKELARENFIDNNKIGETYTYLKQRKEVISKDSHGKDFYISEITDWEESFNFGSLKSSLANLPEDEERFPVTLWAKRFLMDGVQFLQLNSNKMKWSCRPDAPVAFQTDGSNLPKVIRHLKKEKPDFFALWLKHIKDFLPDIEDIKIKEKSEDRSLYLSIKYKNSPELPSWIISDGTLRFLAQTIIAYLPERDRIYMIEEPENGLHPLAIEGIFQSLSSVYDNQVFLATHSPSILSLAEPEQILCFSKSQSGAINIIRGQDHPMLKDWKKDVDLAMLHAAGVLQ